MSLIELNMPTPSELRGRWSALAAVYAAYGWNDIAQATEKAWSYDDGGGNWVSLRFASADKAVLVGHDHEYSSTALTKDTANGSLLLQDAPDWWLEHINPSPETIGFIYGWENNKWLRADYTDEDGFGYAGLLHVTSLKGRHSLSEAVADMFGSADEDAIADLIHADANVTEDLLSKVVSKNITEGVEAAKNFLKAPLSINSPKPQQFLAIQRFINAIESEDFEAIQDYRDEIAATDIPDMVAYYRTLNDWTHKTGCLEIMCDFQDQREQLKDILLDYLTVPESLSFPDGQVETAQITAICQLDGGDFMTYHGDRELLHKKVAEILAEHGLKKSTL